MASDEKPGAHGEAGVELVAVRGNILMDDSDAVVIPVNALLNGVTGALNIEMRRLAGPVLVRACEALNVGRLTSGDAVFTVGGDLRARYVVHAVPPIWRGGDRQEAEKLRSVHRRAIELCEENGLATVAFAPLAQGGRGYPTALAAPVAVAAVREALLASSRLKRVRFYVVSPEMRDAYEAALGR